VCDCQIRSADEKYRDQRGAEGCLDSVVGPSAFNHPVAIWPCHGQSGNQVIVASLRYLFESAENHAVIDFIKEVRFYSASA